MNILLFPPIAFVLIFVFVYLLFMMITPPPAYGATSAIHKASQASEGVTPTAKSEALPEEEAAQTIAPETKFEADKKSLAYRKFFSYAAFFAILHVAGLILASWAFNPIAESTGPVIAYIISVIIILAALFK